MARSRVGFGSASIAFFALVAGMAVIGIPAQTKLGITGLWVTEALAIALPAVVVLLGSGTPVAPSLGLRTPSPLALLAAVVVSAFNQPVVSFLTWLAHDHLFPARIVQDFDQKQRLIESMFAGQQVPMLIAVTIAAPLGEELFFRGFAFPAFARSTNAVVGALLSGACFGFIHFDAVGFLGLMEIGILCAVMRHWSGSIWPAVLAHTVNNAIAGGAFLMGYQDPTVPTPPWILACGAALAVLYAVLGYRILRRPSRDAAEPPGEGLTPARALPAALVWLAALAVGAYSLAAPYLASYRAR